ATRRRAQVFAALALRPHLRGRLLPGSLRPSAERQGLIRIAHEQAGIRSTGDRIDAPVRRDDTESMAGRGEVGEPAPATPGDVEGVDTRNGPVDRFASNRDNLAVKRRCTRTAAWLRGRRPASPAPRT